MKKTTKKLAKRSEALFPAWKRMMNEEQLAAILHDLGPARLLAAAGSGKTRVVVHRVARLVESGVTPSRILVLTFSKKAADELSKRLRELDCDGVRAGTWHSLCLQILKQDRTKWASWEVTEGAKHVLKEVLGYKHMDWKMADLAKVNSFISRCKARLYRPESREAEEMATREFGGRDARRATEAFQRYNEMLEDRMILTFDDFLVFAAEHLESDDDVRARWAAKWDHLIQDEGQDENPAQRHIAHLLARDHRNYMLVGDVFQAIYGFRGSSPEYLAKFDEEWEGAVTYWLPRNYRSGRAIIDAANGIVRLARVDGFEPKDMIAERDLDGSVRALASEDLDGEARNFVAWIQEKVRNGEASYEDFTALFRTNAQSRALEEGLLSARIPYVVVGGTSFYERKEVRDILAYLRVGTGLGVVEDVKRCINSPFRFLGVRFVEKLMDLVEQAEARDEVVDWADAVVETADNAGNIQYRQRDSANEWAALITSIRERVMRGHAPKTDREREEARPESVLEDIIRTTRYIEWIQKEEGEESLETSGAANVRELVRVASRFPTCEALLKYIDDTIRASKEQRDDQQAGGDRVLLMSVHRSKGLEWPHVWVAGMNEMVLPHVKGDPEEERRLAYVAATRARDSLVLSYVRTLATRAGIKDAHPSRFLLDTGILLDDPRPLGLNAEAEVRQIEGEQL